MSAGNAVMSMSAPARSMTRCRWGRSSADVTRLGS
nr:MAG TPA: hypothetical protein [Caudoviricetes sp.]